MKIKKKTTKTDIEKAREEDVDKVPKALYDLKSKVVQGYGEMYD
jgi:hypothetical protein